MLKSPLQLEFPLHWAIFTNNLNELKSLLEEDAEIDLEKQDCRGRTPLMLAITLAHKDCAKELLRRGADADAQNKGMWSVSHEAISHGDPEMIRAVIKHRDFQRNVKCLTSIRNILQKLKETPDFYVEMNWEFSSWVPFVSRLCPSDTYKIYKSGESVRIDTTLVGFEGSSWKRGNQTYLFKFSEANLPQLIIMDHIEKSATVQTITESDRLDDFEPPEEAITFRMSEPISTTYIDVEKISFERSKSGGFFSWITSTERAEEIDGHECKTFNASNVDLVTKQRVEHLSDEDKARFKQESESHPLSSVLKMVRSEITEVSPNTADSLGGITPAEYLDKDFELNCDIGRAKEISRKSNTFKATLWLAEEYPLQLQEQIIPIVDLMASNSAHFARLNNFIRLQLPAGFPVKIEIPLFHVVSAKITFGNINKPGRFVTPIDEPSVNGIMPVTIDDQCFEIPSNYSSFDELSAANWWDANNDPTSPPSGHRHHYSAEQQEEMLLQLAIQQSLQDNSTNRGEDEQQQGNGNLMMSVAPQGWFEAPQETSWSPAADREAQELAIAIQESLRFANNPNAANEEPPAYLPVLPIANLEDDLSMALRLSQVEEEQRRQAAVSEEEELARILELSKQDH
ncbi:unnamed protein product, partial [Mesorhabditis belari]|uniref:Ankyrin repeat domain-containing protein 13D n=1 Tax=Mesorhabditis belari TaxID=2138241 RepID=A0AAF3FAV7_9BILA